MCSCIFSSAVDPLTYPTTMANVAVPMEQMDMEATAQQIQERDNIYGRLSHFEIDKKIGKGQFSEVFRAKCKVDNSIVALKKVQVYMNMYLSACTMNFQYFVFPVNCIFLF